MTARSTSPTPRYYLMAHKPELGIKDPYELNEDQYKAALDLLRAQRTLVGRYWHDAFIQIDDFKNEGVVASGSWPFQVNLLKAEKQPVASIIPGGRRHRLGRHHHAACRRAPTRTAPICGWSIRSRQAAGRPLGLVRRQSRRCPPPARATRLLTDEGCTTNGFDNFDKIKFWTTPTSQMRHAERPCVPYYRWVSDYIGVIGGR